VVVTVYFIVASMLRLYKASK